MIQIIIITQHFPFLPGEQFLETEIKYFATNSNKIKLCILPNFDSDKKRLLDESIELDKSLVDAFQNFEKNKLWYLLKSFKSDIFINELKNKHLNTRENFRTFFWSVSRYQKYLDFFDSYFKTRDNVKDTILYTYWNNEITYALQRLKCKYGYKLISRIHGHDLYQERWESNYLPLKKQFTQNIDRIFTITRKANEYLQKTYHFDEKILDLSRLGVDDHCIVSGPNDRQVFHIVSCSTLIEVKCVDKMIESLAVVAQKNLKVQYIWSHIGDGKLFSQLNELANHLLSGLSNIQFEFKGQLDNKEVYQFYKENDVDVFINVSESEGVPVTIMEAMSCHIPIIAPDVGGISDMVLDGVNGILLSCRCDIPEIVDALMELEFFKKTEIRENSYHIYLEKFSAKRNYEQFLDKIRCI